MLLSQFVLLFQRLLCFPFPYWCQSYRVPTPLSINQRINLPQEIRNTSGNSRCPTSSTARKYVANTFLTTATSAGAMGAFE